MRRYRTSLLAVVALLVPVLNAFAEAEEGHSAHVPSFSDTLPYWVNLFILVTALYFLLRKKLAAAWDDRAASIETLVRKGELELANAQQELKDAQQTLSTVDQDILTIKSQVAAEAANESAQIVKDAEEQAERMCVQARELADAERRATEKAIKEDLADTVIEKAVARLQRELTPESDKALREASIQGLSGLLQKH
jgi:F0F1-type ATP synthase membrane subunit b/b'